MREGVVEDGVLQASFVVSRGKPQKGRLAPGKLK
jgi:hypothetical protein